MGRLMDAVLAVSALAIVSAVAWADWVMSCCGIGVGSEAMSQVLIMVRLEEVQGEGYDTNMAVSRKLSVRFASEFDIM